MCHVEVQVGFIHAKKSMCCKLYNKIEIFFNNLKNEIKSIYKSCSTKKVYKQKYANKKSKIINIKLLFMKKFIIRIFEKKNDC